jgi:hypothetical protein
MSQQTEQHAAAQLPIDPCALQAICTVRVPRGQTSQLFLFKNVPALINDDRKQVHFSNRLINHSLSFAHINRFFAFNKLEKFDVDRKLDFIQFKLDFLEGNSIQRFSHFQEEYLRVQIQKTQNESAEFHNEEYQKFFWEDIHDRNAIVLKRYAFDSAIFLPTW